MELGKQIKKYRSELHLSQEELAEKIYVTRQTISNWETGKNYPDIHSLLLLSSLFHVSLEQLIKGDTEIMKEEIKIEEEQINKFHHDGTIFSILFIISILSFVPLCFFLKIPGIIIWVILFAITLRYCFKVEHIKKANHIHTYQEIIAFTEGKRLDEIETQVEKGKRPYQNFLLMLGSGFFTFLLCLLLGLLLYHFFG